ncbi:MAG: peptidoglycan-binding protein [Methanobrevibacter sp.]|nr:peptidoglycan-binding protein [Methanobrevibacter sp.]MBO7696592.1 peptidoglycan-binding protein [Methanobrevibacter sp.]
MKYIQFARMPMKGRIDWVQKKLITLGYLKENESVPGKRDKKYIKALMKFQESFGMTPNADLTEDLFERLNYN